MAWTVEDFQNRLNEFIVNHLGYSVRKFEETCGLSNGVLAASKAKGPSAEILSKMLDAFPELNLNWLVSGRGTMLVTQEPPCPKNDIHHNQQVVIENWDGLAEVLARVVKSKKK